MAADPTGEGELPEQLAHTLLILAHVGIDFAVGALQIGLGHHGAAAVSGSADIDHVQVVLGDHSVQVGVDESLSRHRAPVAHRRGLHIGGTQGLPEQGIVLQIELPRRQVIGGPPVGVDFAQHVRSEGTLLRHAGRGLNDYLRFFIGCLCHVNGLLMAGIDVVTSVSL